ncbi:glycosyltransferase family 4 protein [Candidatus Pelagibacter sp.]|jgi:glycosyltransferase involved in cell wall biosynthesis|nr:glycosyltransferase family 4 protein [Candidatus Pelagibacter sp.]
MKILFDYSIFAYQTLGGISRYYINLDKEIKKQYSCNILAPAHYNKFLKEYSSYKGTYFKKFPRFTNKLFNLYNKISTEQFIKFNEPEIYHKTYYTNFWPKNFKGKKFLTVYDLIHEKFYKDYNFSSDYRPKKKALENSDAILAISYKTKKDLVEIYGISEKKIFVTHLGVNLEFSKSKTNIIKDPYILYVGDRKRYKNFQNLLKAFAISKKINTNFKLVVFGGGKFLDDEKKLINENDLNQNKIIKIDGDDIVLNTLYKSANLFVFPSKYEGFGLPLLEAASNNCPIACSRIEVFNEIMGQHAKYFDPYSVEEMIISLEEVLFSETVSKNLASKAKLTSSNFSWSKCANETLKIYKDI